MTTYKPPDKLNFYLQLMDDDQMQLSTEVIVIENSLEKSTSFVMGLNPLDVVISRCLIMFSIVWGTIFRFLVFNFVRKQGFLHLPINTMTLAKEGFSLIGWTTLNVVLFALVGMDTPLVQYTGATFCNVFGLVLVIAMYVNLYIGVSIALMRYIYLKMSPIFNKISEKCVATCLTGSFTAYAAVSAWYYLHAPKRTGDISDIVCIGHSPEMAETLYNIKAPNQFPLAAVLAIWICFFTLTYQFFIYIKIYKYLSNHDMNLVSLLPETAIRRRRRKNAIDVAGHVIEFLNFAFVSILMLVTYALPSSLKLWSLMCYVVTDGIMGICKIVVSTNLKAELLEFTRSMNSAFIGFLGLFIFKGTPHFSSMSP